jgi:hypothetical protein
VFSIGGTLSGKLNDIRSPFLYLAWTLVQPIEAPTLVTSLAVVGVVNVGGVAKSSSIGALVCSAELILSESQWDLRADLRDQRGNMP